MAAFNTVGIGWQVGVPSGWGTYGVNLAVELARKDMLPALFFIARDLNLTPAQAAALGPALERRAHFQAAIRGGAASLAFPMLHALGDKLDFPPFLRGLKGHPNIGVVFFESATVPKENLEQARDFALIITGSGWNAEVLTRHGLTNVRNCPQGVDLGLFTPGHSEARRYPGRFTVFSGGKLEYRKGQDLVVAAFKHFHERHPDALLVTAWHNPWPDAAKSLGMSPHVTAAPGTDANGRLDVGGWLAANGLPREAFADLGPLANTATAPLLREMDLAIFPNRCEGGTNLVAMECMACGVPVILSRNTGHLDLIAGENCYALDMQIPMGAVTGRADWEGWGESSIDELLAKMEQAYENRDDAAKRGAAGAAFMQGWGWPTQVERLLNDVAAVV